MSKKRFILPLTVFALLLSFGLAACNNAENGGNGDAGDVSAETTSQKQDESKQQSSSEGKPSSAKQEKINITAAGDKTKLMYGETVQLTADQEGVTWTSSKPEIVSVDGNGLVTALDKGSASIKASKEGFRDGSISISVDFPNITVTADKTSLLVGETANLTASEQGVVWTSSDPTIVSVENGVATALKIGSATIKASKDHFNDGSVTINVVRPEPTATLHMEDAKHYSADGEWTNSNRGPGETPIYSKSSASDGTCVGYFGEGDKETLTFTSSAAVKAEITVSMGHNSSYEPLSQIMTVKFNNAAIDLSAVNFTSDSDGSGNYTFHEISFGEVDLIAGNNVLEFSLLGNAPYLDDVKVYAAAATTIAVVAAPAMSEIEIAEKSLSVEEGATVQIVCTTEGVSYSSSNESVATVDAASGLVTGVAKGSATISVRKDDYKTAKVTITVTEKLIDGEVRVQAEAGTCDGAALAESGTPIVIRSTSTGETCTAQWAENAVLVVKANITVAGNYTLSFVGRAGGQYGTANIDDLAAVIEVKVNNVALTVSGAVSGRTFTNYVLGDVTLGAGETTIEVKGLGTDVAPNIDFFKLTPKA